MLAYVNKQKTVIWNKDFIDNLDCKMDLKKWDTEDAQKAEDRLSLMNAKANLNIDPGNKYYQEQLNKIIEETRLCLSATIALQIKV
jgi:hypothetical protein